MLVEYTYDANGNQLSKTVTREGNAQTEYYTYNAQNQLVQVVNGSNTSTYTYNPDGLRHSKSVNGETRIHVWDGANMAAEILDNGDVVWYIRGVNLLWMDEGVIYDTPDITLYFHNAHGDVVGLVGSFTRQYRYDAFGNEMDESGRILPYLHNFFGNWESRDNNPFRYCGEYFDDETGTLYLRARRYDASIGRFTQQDTHWNPGNSIYGDDPHKLNENSDPLGLNLYTYVPDTAAIIQSGNLYVYGMSNPVMFVDPSGNVAIVDDAVIIVVLATGALFATTAAWISSPEGQKAISDGATALYNGIVIAGQAVTTVAKAAVDGVVAGAQWVGGKVSDVWSAFINIFASEHTKNKRPSTKGKHEKGQTRKQKDQHGEKGDARRTPNPNKRRP